MCGRSTLGQIIGLMGWANHWVNGLGNHWVNALMGWVGASYGYVSKQARVSKPDSRIENRRASYKNARGGGMPTYIYIYIYVYYTHTCTHIRMHACMYTHIHIHVHTYVHTYIHTCIPAHMHCSVLLWSLLSHLGFVRWCVWAFVRARGEFTGHWAIWLSCVMFRGFRRSTSGTNSAWACDNTCSVSACRRRQ